MRWRRGGEEGAELLDAGSGAGGLVFVYTGDFAAIALHGKDPAVVIASQAEGGEVGLGGGTDRRAAVDVKQHVRMGWTDNPYLLEPRRIHVRLLGNGAPERGQNLVNSRIGQRNRIDYLVLSDRLADDDRGAAGGDGRVEMFVRVPLAENLVQTTRKLVQVPRQKRNGPYVLATYRLVVLFA